MTGLLDDTADWWQSRGAEIRDWLADDNGRYAFVVRVRFSPAASMQTFVVTARSSMRTPLGCMKTLVAQAQNKDAALLVRIGDDGSDPRQYVFHPLTILQHGEDRTASDQREDRGEQWVDFMPDWGVRLEAYADGRATLTRPDDNLTPLTDPDGSDGSDGSNRNTLNDYAG